MTQATIAIFADTARQMRLTRFRAFLRRIRAWFIADMKRGDALRSCPDRLRYESHLLNDGLNRRDVTRMIDRR